MIGGIGVMNIMLVSVTERTKEIGVRKAVGATRLNILSQFLIEAVVLTAIGGLAGLAVGELLAFLINRYSPLPAHVPIWAIAVGIGISAGVGIVFGLWPAWKAARLDPMKRCGISPGLPDERGTRESEQFRKFISRVSALIRGKTPNLFP